MVNSQITVAAERKYDVRIGESWLERIQVITEPHNLVLVLIPEDFARESGIAKSLQALGSKYEIVRLPNGEAQKSFQVFQSIIEICGRINLSRSDLIIGIGGGATTDLAGFVAATWLRGLDWVAVPTTLAGMVDAAIGGKTGINSEHGKNLVGALHSPVEVIVDLEFLESLSKRDQSAGLAEVIKCGFIADPSILQDLTEPEIDYRKLIMKSVAVKAAVVSSDFKETFAREILNYGHTVGHAIEMHSDYKLRHGEAVAIGMVFAAELSHAHGTLTAKDVALHRELASKFNLPIQYPRAAWSAVYSNLTRDKKNRGGKIRFVTLEAPGVTDRLEVVSENLLREIYERIAE